MKTKEQLAKDFVASKLPTKDFKLQISYENMFKWGYEAAEPKWISVDKQLPDNDRTVLVWINNTENPQWSGYKLGAYLNEKWYCNEGRKSHEVVTDWSEIPVKKII